jgi:hypothetical protein
MFDHILKGRYPSMARVKPQIGDRVTCREREEAYSSRYASNPECWFEPGDVGTVASVDVPVVRNTRGHLIFCCVDFYKEGIPHNEQHGGSPWRVGLYYDNIVILR